MISFRLLMLDPDPEWAGIEMENLRIRKMMEVLRFMETIGCQRADGFCLHFRGVWDISIVGTAISRMKMSQGTEWPY